VAGGAQGDVDGVGAAIEQHAERMTARGRGDDRARDGIEGAGVDAGDGGKSPSRHGGR
jgi:hypothetical protein